MPLTDLALRTAKGREKPYKLADSGGLYALVQTNGNRLWRLDYRMFGKRKTLALGAYPLVSLADAREKRDTAKKQIADGIDPSMERKAQRIAATISAENTFGSVVTEYLNRMEHDGAAEQTLSKNRWLLEKLAQPLKDRPIADIGPAEVLSVLMSVERSGRLESAVRLRSAISAVFRLAVATMRATNDPTYALKGATKSPKVVSQPAITDPKRLGWLLREIDAYDGWPTLRCALQFIALTVARPGEVRCAEWKEFNLARATWVIPAQRTKMRREHEVPLSPQALAVLREVAQLTGKDRLVFSSIRNKERPLSENALNAALRRIGVPQNEHTAHGFRSSFSTILNECRQDAEVIELCLAHVDGNKVRQVYNRSSRWQDRTALMAMWAGMLDEYKRG